MKIVLGGVFVLSLFLAVPACADDAGRIGVALTVNVRILDFETTKTLCASTEAPDWCPEHLRVVSVAQASLATDDSPGEAIAQKLSAGEYEKRARIRRIK